MLPYFQAFGTSSVIKPYSFKSRRSKLGCDREFEMKQTA
jgi:hypothetical protein